MLGAGRDCSGLGLASSHESNQAADSAPAKDEMGLTVRLGAGLSAQVENVKRVAQREGIVQEPRCAEFASAAT